MPAGTRDDHAQFRRKLGELSAESLGRGEDVRHLHARAKATRAHRLDNHLGFRVANFDDDFS